MLALVSFREALFIFAVLAVAGIVLIISNMRQPH